MSNCEGSSPLKDVLLNKEVDEKKKRPNLTEIINKYMEEAYKRQAKQEEWLKKFYQSTEASREIHDKIIQGLEVKEIEYFSTNSGFSDNEEQETDDSGMAEAVAALEATVKKKREEPKKVKKTINYYVDPYEPPIPFPKRLEHHVEEALLEFKNALPDLGASISIMPFSMNSRKSSDKIDKFFFLVDFVILDMVEDIRMPIILGRPLLATAYAKVEIFRKTISLEVRSEKVIFKMRSSFTTTNVESVRSIKNKTFVEDDNLKEIDYDLFLYDSKSYEEDDLEEYLEDPKECREDKANTILGVIHDKLNNDWFNNTSEDEDDLEGILDYLKPISYDEFIDVDDEAYNKRMYRLLGMTYEEPTPIIIEKAKVTRYIVGPGETYTKVKVLGVENIPRTWDNVAVMRARFMKKMAQEGNNQAKTFFVSKNGIRSRLNSYSCGSKVLSRRNHFGETRLFYRHFARSHLLQLSLGEENDTQGSLLL
ncbi:hypothetical protein Tco_0064591 [Tanacetum coccineum]